MAKAKKSGKNPPRKENHPTIFVWDGAVQLYDEGSMLSLHTQVTNEEWELMVEQTVQYKVFLECLKETAYPILGESWDDEDDWFRIQLDVAVSRMRNIDSLLVLKHDKKNISEIYTEKMKRNATEVQKLVEDMRKEKREALQRQYNIDDKDTAVISNL